MSVFVKCDLCIECLHLVPSRSGDMVGICQRSGQTKDWFDVGKCIGMVKRSPEEVKSLVSELVELYSNQYNDVDGVFSGDLGAFIPLGKDGFIGYHAVEEDTHSRPSKKSTENETTAGGEKSC